MGLRPTAGAPPPVHAPVGGVIEAACVGDLILRSNLYSAATRTPVAAVVLTLAALVLSVVGGKHGGRLAYRVGIGVGGRHG